MHKPLDRFIASENDEKRIEWMMEMQSSCENVSSAITQTRWSNRILSMRIFKGRVGICALSERRQETNLAYFSAFLQTYLLTLLLLRQFRKASMGSRFSSFFGARGKFDGSFAEQNGSVSDYLVSNVNAFGKAGGFDSIIKRLSCSRKEESAGDVQNKRREDVEGITMEELDAVLHALRM